MFELECLRRRIEDRAAAQQAARDAPAETVLNVEEDAEKAESKNGLAGGHVILEEIIDEMAKTANDEDDFTGHSCLLVTWKTNPEIEKFKVLKSYLRLTKVVKV